MIVDTTVDQVAEQYGPPAPAASPSADDLRAAYAAYHPEQNYVAAPGSPGDMGAYQPPDIQQQQQQAYATPPPVQPIQQYQQQAYAMPADTNPQVAQSIFGPSPLQQYQQAAYAAPQGTTPVQAQQAFGWAPQQTIMAGELPVQMGPDHVAIVPQMSQDEAKATVLYLHHYLEDAPQGAQADAALNMLNEIGKQYPDAYQQAQFLYRDTSGMSMANVAALGLAPFTGGGSVGAAKLLAGAFAPQLAQPLTSKLPTAARIPTELGLNIAGGVLAGSSGPRGLGALTSSQAPALPQMVAAPFQPGLTTSQRIEAAVPLALLAAPIALHTVPEALRWLGTDSGQQWLAKVQDQSGFAKIPGSGAEPPYHEIAANEGPGVAEGVRALNDIGIGTIEAHFNEQSGASVRVVGLTPEQQAWLLDPENQASAGFSVTHRPDFPMGGYLTIDVPDTTQMGVGDAYGFIAEQIPKRSGDVPRETPPLGDAERRSLIDQYRAQFGAEADAKLREAGIIEGPQPPEAFTQTPGDQLGLGPPNPAGLNADVNAPTAAELAHAPASELPQSGTIAGRLGQQPQPIDEAALAINHWSLTTEKLSRAEQDAMFARQRQIQAAKGAEAFQTLPPGEAFSKAREVTSGEYERPTFKPLDLTPEQHDAVISEIARSGALSHYGERLNAQSALNKLEAGTLPMPHEMAALSKVLGPTSVEVVKNISRMVPLNLKDKFIEAVGIPRVLMTTADMSAALRQAILLGPGHPFAFAKNFVDQIKAFGVEKFAQETRDQIMAHPDFQLGKDAGLSFTDSGMEYGKDLNLREEPFQSHILQSGKIGAIQRKLGNVVGRSERAFATMTNGMRWDIFYDQLKAWRDQGREITPEKAHQLALYLNNSTGRGSIRGVEEFAPAANAVLFSPRMLASRAQLIGDLLRPSQDPQVRMLAAKDLGTFVATGVSILTLMKLTGVADVQTDPRSSDFGKYNIGGQRHDFWAGYGPIARIIAQEATGQVVKQGANGNVVESRDRTGAFLSFLRTKLSPTAGLAVDIHQGTTQGGAPVDWASLKSLDLNNPVIGRMVPLFIQDAIQGYRQNGALGGATAGTSSFFGEGVQSYDLSPKSMQGATNYGLKDQITSLSDYPDAAKVYQLPAIQKTFANLGIDPSQYQSLDELKAAYIAQYAQAVAQHDGISLPEAKTQLGNFFDKQAPVKQFKTGMTNAMLYFWKQHPDLLTQAVEQGYFGTSGPAKALQNIVDEYRKAHPGRQMATSVP